MTTVIAEASDAALHHEKGPMLLLGGPGTGKTTLLENRYLRLIEQTEVSPHRVLILCINRAYSMEAKDRLVRRLAAPATVEVPIYTWHSLANHLVSRYYPSLGYREPPVLLTGPEQWGVVRELMTGAQRIDWPHWADRLQDRGFIDEVADFCLRVQQRMIAREDLAAMVEHKPEWAEVVRFFDIYTEHLKNQSRLDYAGLISTCAQLLEQDAGVRETLSNRFPHVMIDDAQEMSPAHIKLVQQLGTASLLVAADPDCGIETFRGAEPDWVYGFAGRFGEHQTVVLNKSYRLGSPLLGAAQRLIGANDETALHRITEPANTETVFESRLYGSIVEETDAIARELRLRHLSGGLDWRDMAVLISQPGPMLGPLERALQRWEVPHHPLSGDRPIASEQPVTDFLDLVKVALGLAGWEATLPNLLTSRLIGLGHAQRRDLEREAWQTRRSLADMVQDSELTAEYRELAGIVKQSENSADECFWRVYESASYYRGLVAQALADPGHAANSELDALVAFSHALGRFVERRHGRGSIRDYLSEASRADFGGDPWLPPARTRDPNRVSLLSFHSARGRQWHTVIVAGCLDAWIPKGRRAQGLFDPLALEISDIADREIEAMADDRRTFYVASTRATHQTIFTVSAGPSGRGRPSRFLSEIGAPVSEQLPSIEQQPLTMGELRSRLRRTLADTKSPSEARVAAVIALAEVPDVTPSNWYGRWDWTEGTSPLFEEGKFRTSYSRISVFENCGLQYVLQSVLGLDPASTHSMKFGTWIHALFQAVHERKINDIPTLKAEYNAMFDESIFPNAAMAAQFRRDGDKMLQTFWEGDLFKQDNVITEQKFEVPFAGVTLRGRIDRIDIQGASTKLYDYKTARWAMSSQQAAKSLQLAIYILAARTDPELVALGRPAWAELVYPGSTWPDGRPKRAKQTAEQADEVLEGLPDLLQRVMREDFRPSPEADCHFCKMKPLCPLWPQGREVEV